MDWIFFDEVFIEEMEEEPAYEQDFEDSEEFGVLEETAELLFLSELFA